MDEEQKKQINKAIELMNSICYRHRIDDGGLAMPLARYGGFARNISLL